MIDLNAPDPFSLTWWKSNLVAEDPVKTIWFMCAIARSVYGWDNLDLIERSMRVKPVPAA